MKKNIPLLFTLSCIVMAAGSGLAYDTHWMARVVEKRPCIESLGSVLSSPDQCWSWTRRETAAPFYDSLHERILVGGTDGLLHVVDKNNGATTKRISLEGNLVSSIVRSKNGNLVFATDTGSVYSLKADTLETEWKINLEVGVLETPYVEGDNIYLVSQIGTLYAISQGSGTIHWFKKRQLPNRIFLRRLSTPIMVESEVNTSKRNVLVMGNPDGNLEFIDPDNGAIVEELPVGNTKEPFADVATKPVFENGTIYAASANSGLVAVDATTRVKRWSRNEVGITQIEAASGIIVAAGAKFILAVNAHNGEELWRFSFPKGSPSAVHISRGEVWVGSDLDRLYVFDLFTGLTLQKLGSGLGFASAIENIEGDLLAMSAAGVLFKFGRNERISNIGKKARN